MPGHTSTHRRAASSVPLKITVVGGSIAGLASAYALQRAGHNVTVIEKSDGNIRSRGALRCPPNMTRLLNKWGFGPSLDKYAHKCSRFMFREGESGQSVGILRAHEQFLKQLRADFLIIQHGDLYSILLQHALEEGVTIRYGSQVVQVDSTTVTVVLENGERLASDVVVGADGSDSLVRMVVDKDVRGKKGKDIALNFTIPVKTMKEDEELRTLLEDRHSTIWLGDGYMFYATPVNRDQDYSVMMGYVLPDDAVEYKEAWVDSYPLEHFNLDLQKFEPRLCKMLRLAKNIVPHVYASRPTPENLVCDHARVVLVGEAAQTLAPSGYHTTSLAIEDAQTLGGLLTGIQDRGHVPLLLSAYEELRQTRCMMARKWERYKWDILTLPHGPGQQARDAQLREVLKTHQQSDEELDEKPLRDTWADELEMFFYDASEVVEDWWTKWDPVLSRVNPTRRSTLPKLQVKISKDQLGNYS